jgi:hypothetical protein
MLKGDPKVKLLMINMYRAFRKYIKHLPDMIGMKCLGEGLLSCGTARLG